MTSSMEPAPHSCLLLTSDHEELARSAETFTAQLFDVRLASRQSRAQKALPPALTALLAAAPVDYLFNFLSPVIVPATVLRRVKRAAINFHPAPPEWPGVGSASYALYEGAASFGVTAHLMNERVDAGIILRVDRFPITIGETCEELFNRSLERSLQLFRSVLSEIKASGELNPCGETWRRKAITRKEFEAWMTLSSADPIDVIHRKERALRHSRFPGPFLEVAGLRFELPPRKTA